MVGFARAIILILTEGNVIDTVLYYASLLINKTSSSVAAAVIYVFTFFFNFLVPSGSGKAAIVMPLLVPMADMADITRQTAVLAYQLGDGPTNLFWPTAAMAALAMGNVPYEQVVQVVSAPDPCDFRGIHHHCRHLCPGGLRPVLRQERNSHELSGDQAAGRGKLRFRGSDPQKIPRASGTEQPGA
ncbi:MAG: TIGR00366 family protein [Dysosmobacter sp.]